ncbi:Alpha-D-glucose 1-phosphate phosphatase YihX [Flagellimonas maritima]|uniref:Alpha-D-glucose 1-phosphate phosphatase YihX n=1 Tax=Flagellimonas maritima TaxID=1383885 RepID=A0A2Z4LYF9_9FLAO|nr:HAD family phosphatase [Allomuricauda aurantiaca]AWX46388.1 Alpha-D-glucose 1-phosphate phosphatase YihX [Allomuricauda aurantiaca]
MIKIIILDFGDIFIDLDKSATARFMGRFGFKKLTPDLDELFKNYEKGHMSSRSFLEKVSGHFPMANELDLVTAWNSILLNFPDERLKFIETLAKEEKYRLFLLSNTNDIHIEFVKRQMGLENFNRFKNAFEAFYLSYEMGMRKPDTEIFEFVLKENNLKAEETLFVDDTKENTDAASHLGIKTWNLKVGQEDITQLKAKL